ncbi:MAG TPA: YIP1 family protein [bacterium]|nr:YIP1 family protein [bacterium]
MIYECPGCHSRFRCDSPGVVECPSCGAKSKVVAVSPVFSAWDDERGGNWVGAFFNAIKFSLMKPVEFFEAISQRSGWLRPWAYALVVSCVVFLFSAAYQAGFQALALGLDLSSEVRNAFIPFAAITLPFSAWVVVALCAVVVPVFTTGVLLLQSAVYHACLIVIGEARGGFEQTFRVVCYSNGPQLFQIVPLLGGAIGPVWQLVLIIIGVKVSHKTSYARSALAVFLPTILCCGILFIASAAILGGVMGAAIAGGG